MEVFTRNMTIAVIMVHSECPEVPNSRRNRERSHLLRGRIYLAIWKGQRSFSKSFRLWACAFTMSYPAATSWCVGVQNTLNNTHGYRCRPGQEYKGWKLNWSRERKKKKRRRACGTETLIKHALMMGIFPTRTTLPSHIGVPPSSRAKGTDGTHI